MKAYGGVAVEIHVSLTSVPVEVSGQLHAPAALYPEIYPAVLQGQSGQYGEVKSLVPTRARPSNPRSSSPQAVALPTKP
jgi:hypothetical protein